jgi:A/G-specific adenine glycosylase
MFTPPSSRSKKAFTKGLLEWNRNQNTREMPWKGEKDPYRIWISEIILQQTRVDQGLAYYKNFIRTFPTIRHLAKAPDEKVFKCWEGLGYYSRCRNLLATARYIVKEKKGVFPGQYEEILELKGIGPYTAAAIGSFAFQLPYAVVDGNVFRVLSRYFGISLATDTTEGKKIFSSLAQELLDPRQPGPYNQAIMDFGAVICKPAVPFCDACVFRKNCTAFIEGRVDELPQKQKKTKVRERWFNYIIPVFNKQVAIRQRKEKDIWQDLYEFPMIETAKAKSVTSLMKMAAIKKWFGIGKPVHPEKLFQTRQLLSHQLVHGQFILLELDREPLADNDWQWVKKNKLAAFSFPGLINQSQVKQLLEQK